jgi:hypothetical protein
MAGDPTNAAVWANADVYIGALSAVTPGMDASTPAPDGSDFSADWDVVGLLSGDDGFTRARSSDNSDFYAWGGILVATSRKNFKETVMFTALEDNETVFDLFYPGSSLTFTGGDYAGQIMVPDLSKRFKVAFQVQNGDTITRLVSRNYAQLEERGDQKLSESDLASQSVTVAIYPEENDDGAYVLWDTFKGQKTSG